MSIIPYPVAPNTIYNWDASTLAKTMRGCGFKVNCVVTSPPYYGLRDYGVDGQIGLEPTPDEYVAALVGLFREIREILTDDGVVWLNLGDSYVGATSQHYGSHSQGHNSVIAKGTYASVPANGRANRNKALYESGLQMKQLLGIPWHVAFALQADGWYLRSDIIWAKGNPMPESVKGSHFSRHRVTIAEYERLSRLREEQRNNQDGSCDLSGLPSGEISSSETKVSEKPERSGDGKSTRTTPRRESQAIASSDVAGGQGSESEIRTNGKGASISPQAGAKIPLQRTREDNDYGVLSQDQDFAHADSSYAQGEREVQSIREDESQEAQRLRTTKSGNRSRSPGDSGGLAGDSRATQGQMSLLRETPETDSRPHNSDKQGREARQGEHSSGVPELQLEEEGQDNETTLVDCPGCPLCEEHGGYIFHMSAGRPTKSHEYVFLLAKSASYYYDADAIAEPSSGVSGGGWSAKVAAAQPNHGGNHYERPIDTGNRNKRTVWNVNTAPFSGAHFATFPPKLIEPMILAGCPETVCAVCGKPHVRMVERETNWQERREAGAWAGNVGISDTYQNGVRGKGMSHDLNTKSVRDLGFAPTCTCNGDTRPGVVFDPFMGAGTTALVARQNGRAYVGSEINPEYVAIAQERLRLPFEQHYVEQPAAELSDLPLFAAVSE